MHKEIKSLYDLSYDGDDFGSCMQFAFAIAETLYRHDLFIPDEWQFRPGLSAGDEPDDWPDVEIDALYREGWVSEQDLIDAGNVFSRYQDILHAQERSY